jgi:hypothetical protein
MSKCISCCRDSRGDEDINTNDTSMPTQVTISGPITHTRAHQLNYQVSSFFSSCPSYLDNGNTCTLFCLGMMEWRKRGEGMRRLDLDCRTVATCDGRHNFIWTPFWACKCFMEILSILLSNGSSLISISIRSRLQLSI